jgi:putative DNA primase/helicase
MDDEGNAARFAALYSDDLMYVAEYKRWFYWDGSRWTPSIGQETEAAMKFIGKLHEEAAMMKLQGRDEDHKRMCTHIVKTAGKIPYLVSLASKTPEMRAETSALDANRSWLNFGNAVVDVRDGTLMVSDPLDRLTKRTTVPYKPNATAPLWDAFLADVLPDPAMREYVQRLAGYSLLGDVNERLLVFLYGEGRNGKSVFVEVLRELLGDYALGTPVTTFLKKMSGGEMSNDLARLRGARFIAASEFEEGARVNNALLKRVTGDEKITARPLYGEFFDFVFEGTIWVSTNHMPFFGNDQAVWDRIKVIPFTVRIPDDKVDVRIKAKLLAEGAGILQWVLDGARSYMEHGLEEPVGLLTTRVEMRYDQDLLSTFVEERCEVDHDYVDTSNSLYMSYVEWATMAGEKPTSKRTFGIRLKTAGYEQIRLTDGVRAWRGLRRKASVNVGG